MLKRTLAVTIVALFIAFAGQINATNIDLNTKVTEQEIQQQVNKDELNPAEVKYKEINALDLVKTPDKYLSKNVKIKAKFDKFCAIGLDYPPVKKDAKTYISFLIKRENTTYNIPLSELKLMLKRTYAEKELINIESGDEIEIYGNVFSAALGDPWVEVNKIVILTPKAKKDTKETADKKTEQKE